MMRTPAKSVVRNARNASQIGKTLTPTKTTHQITSILYRPTMSPVPVEVVKEKRKDDEISSIDNNLSIEVRCSSEDDFIKTFIGWLVETNGKIDCSTFSRIKGDLLQIVGKYELEFGQKKV